MSQVFDIHLLYHRKGRVFVYQNVFQEQDVSGESFVELQFSFSVCITGCTCYTN